MFFPSGASVSVWTFCNSCIWVSCPQCEKMNLKIIQSLLERIQIHKNVGKPKNLWDLKDFSEEQQAVLTVQDKQGTHEQLSLKQTNKQKKNSCDHSGNNTVLRIKCMQTFERGHFINSPLIFSCGLYVNIFYVKYLIQVSTKLTITCILYDPSYFGKIINIFQILQGVCKLLTSTVFKYKYIVLYIHYI